MIVKDKVEVTSVVTYAKKDGSGDSTFYKVVSKTPDARGNRDNYNVYPVAGKPNGWKVGDVVEFTAHVRADGVNLQ